MTGLIRLTPMHKIFPLSLALLLLSLTGFGTCADDLEPYPMAAEGQVRHVVRLPALEEGSEQDRRVEIIVSRKERLDPANRYFYGGEIESKTVEGWGYTYYSLEKVGPLAGTRMAVPPGTPKGERPVRVNGGLDLVRYNSKLPVVVYTPAGFDVEVRVWSAGESLPAGRE